VSAKALFPWIWARVMEGKDTPYALVEEIPDETTRSSVQRFGVKSGMTVSFSIGGRVAGLLAFASTRAERQWPDEIVNRLRLVGRVFANVIARRQADEALATAMAEIKRLDEKLKAENVYLRREVTQALGPGLVVGHSAAIAGVLEQVRQVAPTGSSVLLLGETGSGKELIATQIHELSPRRDHLMVRVNCAAIPEALIESELFGREKGAYTGALTRQTGRFELADRSTIFLDEIGDLPLAVQVKLLRVIEDLQVERLGGSKPIRVDARIIAATHRNLEEMVAAGRFREDLYYRLNVFPIRVPPLRERVEDIPLLVWRFVEEFSKRFGKPIDAIGKETMLDLQRYQWPGNVRELRNLVERAMIVTQPGRLSIALPTSNRKTPTPRPPSSALVDVEMAHISGVLEATGWRVRGKGGAAERLGLKPSTLETRMAKLGIRRPDRRG
jgi:transcriptional regulator with GAF, ATPase, and Fis domain